MISNAKKWVGYLEHQSEDLLGAYTANVGKGYCTIFSDIIRSHYHWRNFTGVPWCAVFVHAVCLETYGKKQACKLLGKPHPGTRVLARRLKRWGRFIGRDDYVPLPGDLIFLHNGDGRISHCGIVERVESGSVVSIEGNTTDSSGHFDESQGGAVAVRKRELIHPAIVGYGIMNRSTKRSVKNQNG